MCWLSQYYASAAPSSWKNKLFLEEFSLEVCKSKKFITWGLSEKEVLQELISIKPKNYVEACVGIYLLYAKVNKSGATVWGDKNNFHTSHIEKLKEFFPQAIYLHIIRDPRDVACSYRDMQKLETSSSYKPTLPTDISEIACDWVLNNNSVIKKLAVLPKERIHTVLYENLVTDPFREIKKICDSLKIPFEDEMLEFHILNKKHQLEPEATLDWKKRTLEKITPSQVGRFKNELSEDDVNNIQFKTADLMKRFGYTPV
jgi:hypothetical protein